MTRPPCVRLCPAYPGNPRKRIEGESPPQGKGHTVFAIPPYALRLLARQRHVLVRRRVAVARDQAKPGLAHPRAGAVDEGLSPNRRVDCPLVHELLDLVQRRCAPRAVELARLLLKQRVDVGIAAVDIGASLDDESLKPGGGVAERAALTLDEILEALLRIAFEEGRPLERPELGPDADLLDVVEHGLGQAGVRAVAVEFAGVEALRVARFGQQSPGLRRIVCRGRRLPVVFEDVRNDAAGELGLAERQSLVDGVAVDGEARRAPRR